MFIVNSILFGIGLAMDAFSVSLANGLNDSKMKKRVMCKIAGTFGFFQALMPMLGWICVHTVVKYFTAFEQFIPWIALVLLLYIGGKMLYDGIKGDDSDDDTKLSGITLLIQGIATSIDALSVGFTIADYDWNMALSESLIIAVVTFIICMAGLRLGKRFGTKLAGKAQIFGGVILMLVGVEIFVTGVFF